MNQKLKEYHKLVEFLAVTLGPNYEVVLYDLTDKKGKIIAIANNHLTNRAIGDSLSPYLTKMLEENNEDDFILNYSAKANSGRTLRSSSLFIRDKNKIIGVLNLNFDDFLFVDIAEKLISLVHPDQHLYSRKNNQNTEQIDDVISASPLSLVDQVIENYFLEREIDLNKLVEKERKTLIEKLDQDEKIKIVTELQIKGVFLVKGAVIEVAKKLYCSQPTVYRYLNSIK